MLSRSILSSAALLATVLLAGCGSSPIHRSSVQLNDRLHLRLAPEIASGQVSVLPLANGAQVVVSSQALFAPGTAALTGHGRYVLASVIEGLLEPRLLQIALTAAPDATAGLQQQRVTAVQDYLGAFAIESTPAQMAGGPVGLPSGGVAITVIVHRRAT